MIKNPDQEIEKKKKDKEYCNFAIKVIAMVIQNKENHRYLKSSSVIREIVYIMKISM